MTERDTGATLPIDTAASGGEAGPAVLVLTPEGLSLHPITEAGALVIGRADEADVRIADPSISRQHARLDVSARSIAVVDLGSANGVVVRGRKIAAGTPVGITAGEPVQLGNVTVVVQAGARPKVRGWIGRAGGPSVFVPDADAAPRLTPVVAADAAMRDVVALADRVAQSAITVLLTGETGVGKEVIARRIHEASGRTGPLLQINCAAIAETLLESEMFGHERGAFTGATADKPGLLESAAGGTVMLDEIGEMALPLQAKLLRALEQREVLRVGGRQPVPIDVRFVAATNRDLLAEIERGTFRADLYYRVAGICIAVPPLRDRPADLQPLVERFLPPGRGLSERAWAALRAHPFPGNVRELRHALEHAAVLAGATTIEPAHLPPAVVGATREPACTPPDDERERILWALDRCAHNQTRAAELLGVSRRTLVSRLQQYGIPRPRKKRGDG